MDVPKYQKSDPAILLLNEIDILLAQTRLMELYLKQAQATAANENARLHEQYESELASLRAELAAKEKQLQARPVVPVDRNLSAAFEQLQRELSEKQQFLSGHEAAFQRSTSEIIALQNRIAQLEAENSAAVSAARESNAIRESLAADVAALNQELEKNRREFHQQQLAAREIESGLREQLQRLHNQVAENQANSFGTADELRKAQQEIAELRQHLGSLEALQDDLQANAARELEQARGRFESELATLRTTLAERDRTVVESQAALLEIERDLRSEITALRNELEKKQTALAVRDGDLRAAGTQITALQQRVADLELAHIQATATTAEIDSIRRSLAEQVANLQHEVEVKERELTHRYEAVTAVEIALHGRIQELQQELARSQEASAAYEVELENHRAQSAALQRRIIELEHTQADTSSLEATRQQLEGDLNRLHADLAQKEYLVAGHERALADLKASSAVEIATLHQQLEQERSSATTASQELLRSNAELDATREALDAQLKLKDDEIDSLRASAASQTEQLCNQVNELQQQLSERERGIADLEARLGVEIATLHQQLEQERSSAASASDEVRQAYAELTTTREALDAALRQKHDEIEGLRASATSQNEQLSRQVNDLQRQLSERERGIADLEARLGVEITTLHQQLEQERSSATTASHERLQAQAELDATRDGLDAQLKLKDDEIDSLRASTASQTEQLCNQVNELQQQLSERERGIADLEARLGVEIATLHQQLEQERSSATTASQELLRSNAELDATREALDAQLKLKDDEIDSLRASTASQTEQLCNQVNELQQQLSERERGIADLEARLGVEIATLHQQLEQERSSAASASDEVRQAYAELTTTREALDAALRQKHDEIEGLRASATSQNEQLSRQVNDLQRQLSERERGIADLEARLGVEITTLHQQLEQERSSATTASHERLQAQAELDATRDGLDAQLRLKDEELEGLRASATGQYEQLSNRINELQLQLAEKQLLTDSRASELGDLRTTVSQLSEQLSEKDNHFAQARTLWQNTEAQQINEIAQLSAAREELSRAQTALEVQLDQARSANAGLRGELQEAKNRRGEFEELLQRSEAAMTVVESDRARLRISLEETDALHDKSKAEAARELAEVRNAFETEITELRSELQQKAWSLAQQQASVENLAQIHREQIRKLEARLGEQQPVTEQQTRELEQALRRADSLQQQVAALQAELQQTQGAGASQAEQIRQDYAARLDSANALLAAKSAELAKSGAVRANVEEGLRAEITRLNNEMQSRAAALQSREDELDRVREEMTSVQNRIVQLESFTARTESEAREISQAKNSLESDLGNLRNELQQKSAAVMQQQIAIDDLDARHRSQVEQLEANLSAYQRSSEERRREVNLAQAQIAQLHNRVQELQAALQQTEVSANSRTEELRQEYQARVDTLSRELAENAAQLHDRVGISSDIEHALRSEIDRLIGEGQERNQILQDRNDELVRVKGELDSLSERFTQLESNAIQAESSASGDAERMRTEYQAQLALLQAELSQKEWAVEERQAIIAGLEQEHRLQIEALRQQLAEKERTAASNEGAFVMGDPNLTAAQQEKLHKLDDMVKAIRSGEDVSYPAPSGRRWQNGFGWKRRWRS